MGFEHVRIWFCIGSRRGGGVDLTRGGEERMEMRLNFRACKRALRRGRSVPSAAPLLARGSGGVARVAMSMKPQRSEPHPVGRGPPLKLDEGRRSSHRTNDNEFRLRLLLEHTP